MANSRFKFRAWNEQAKRYSKPFTLKCSVLNFTDDDGLGVMKSLTDEVVEQFTGLTDKNGVDIYEGDIVDHDEGDLWVVKYEFSETLEGYASIGFQCFCRSEWSRISVIGNIHKNPDFLCAKK